MSGAMHCLASSLQHISQSAKRFLGKAVSSHDDALRRSLIPTMCIGSKIIHFPSQVDKYSTWLARRMPLRLLDPLLTVVPKFVS
jgi:hypothetical protein